VRTFEDLPDAVRLGCPDDEEAMERLLAAIAAVTRPDALLLDVDGVLVDVSESYDQAILQTCASFGVQISRAQLSSVRAQGGANDDWTTCWRLLSGRVALARVQERFEALYQGGLWRAERLRLSREALQRLCARFPVALVTGRPRRDLQRLLEVHALDELLPVAVCREDGPLKPDPWPVQEALRRLGVRSAWMLGDTVDDIRAAHGAGVVPIGVLAPGEGEETARALLAAGAARVLASPEEVP
jgi:HAD superfamily hydrolase (TIGR01548 family)